MENIKLSLTLGRNQHDTSDEIAKLSQQLMNEILKLNIENADYLREEKTKKGSKAGDVISWETLLITLAASGGVISTFINFILGWSTRNEGRSVVLELNGDKLEVTGLSASEQKKLIETWLKRSGGILLK
ncbi:MAG: hypothetical protein HN392_13295 [Anaerolineae bacterium]|jgi:hypothetical protein|nr:hypothetical protein [Anaerolineae bacterium]MBT7075177.1 hypothetical protein [Anaerolineae bacterium]